LLTEKAMDLSEAGKYTFRVSKEANKIEIAAAVQTIFNVHVTKVNTINVKGKKKRVGRYPEGKTKDWKKAVVTLAEGQTITLFEGL
jgi:large subunit ribosomal protein L23